MKAGRESHQREEEDAHSAPVHVQPRHHGSRAIKQHAETTEVKDAAHIAQRSRQEHPLREATPRIPTLSKARVGSQDPDNEARKDYEAHGPQ